MTSAIPPMTVRLGEREREGVSLLAKLTNRSRSYIVTQAVQDYLAKNAAYLQELNEAVESIETRPSYEAEEVFAWMDTWGTAERKPFEEAVVPHYKNK
ncbi:MAG: CopG family ribbon-helix-helix protein [bacterium]